MTKPISYGMKRGAFICIDWGTTNLRGYLVSQDGVVLERYSASEGIRSYSSGEHLTVVRRVCLPWLQDHDVKFIILGGMLGSEFGLRNVPMVQCPASMSDIVESVIRIREPDLPPIGIIPGVFNPSSGHLAGMMRGEETQILGAMEILHVNYGLFCLPGTHTKWVRVDESRFMHIGTSMTGEVFDLLREHSVLRPGLKDWDGVIDHEAFLDGLRIAERGFDSINAMFLTRAQLVIGEETDAARRASRLSGILIGCETRSMLSASTGYSDPEIFLVCSEEQAALYGKAARILGRNVLSVDVTDAFIFGARQIYLAVC